MQKCNAQIQSKRMLEFYDLRIEPICTPVTDMLGRQFKAAL